jgi:hypothetical protein
MSSCVNSTYLESYDLFTGDGGQYTRGNKSSPKGHSMAARKGAAKSAPDRKEDFYKAFYALKRIFAPYENRLHVTADSREKYYLETKSRSYNGRPLFFGAAILGRSYVSFHLMPLYWDSSLARGISSELRKHMQGKSCFNFTAPEPTLFRELAKLTTRGFALYNRKNLL